MSKLPVLEVKNLKQWFPVRAGWRNKIVNHVKAVDDVSFSIYEGETLGLVGESGCGKTTTARCIMRALDPTDGKILYYAEDTQQPIDLTELRGRELMDIRREIQLVFQDPFTSLNPRMRVLDLVGEPLVIHGTLDREARVQRVIELMRSVGLRPEYMRRYPHAFSGGERQRISIARSLALQPRLMVLDEPVSALDVSVQAQVLNLLLKLQNEFGLTYLFVAHDLSVVKHISTRVAVMYVGRIVETAPTEQLYTNPKHPYTAALLSAVPVPDPNRRKMSELTGEVASPANPPSGCYFHPRCEFAVDRCRTETPALREIEPGHHVRCHRADELDLPGVDILVEDIQIEPPPQKVTLS